MSFYVKFEGIRVGRLLVVEKKGKKVPLTVKVTDEDYRRIREKRHEMNISVQAG
jgi:hypothetical protein